MPKASIKASNACCLLYDVYDVQTSVCLPPISYYNYNSCWTKGHTDIQHIHHPHTVRPSATSSFRRTQKSRPNRRHTKTTCFSGPLPHNDTITTLQVLYQVLIYDSRICGTRYVAQVRVFLVRFIIWGYRGTHPSMGVPGYLPEYGITGYLPEYGVPGHLPEYGLPGYLPVYWGIRVHTSMGVPGYIPKYGGTRVHTRVVGTRVATRVMDTRVSTPV